MRVAARLAQPGNSTTRSTRATKQRRFLMASSFPRPATAAGGHDLQRGPSPTQTPSGSAILPLLSATSDPTPTRGFCFFCVAEAPRPDPKDKERAAVEARTREAHFFCVENHLLPPGPSRRVEVAREVSLLRGDTTYSGARAPAHCPLPCRGWVLVAVVVAVVYRRRPDAIESGECGRCC